jgi:ABC-type sulfate/molybdate transport systems ATPase subunit
MTEPPILQARIVYRRGSFALSAEFALRSQWTVLFGNSGAGKTTLLRILAGLTEPAEGAVFLAGLRLVDTARNVAVAPGRRRIGFVAQQAALFPNMTARQNIAFGMDRWARAAGEARIREARIEELLRLFEIEFLAQRRPRQLSGGERQRVALAQALAPRPDLLLLDEPFNALDVSARIAMVEKLRSTGVPVLYVSHDLADAWQINADAIVLESGRVLSQGETRTILAPQREQILAQLGG